MSFGITDCFVIGIREWFVLFCVTLPVVRDGPSRVARAEGLPSVFHRMCSVASLICRCDAVDYAYLLQDYARALPNDAGCTIAIKYPRANTLVRLVHKLSTHQTRWQRLPRNKKIMPYDSRIMCTQKRATCAVSAVRSQRRRICSFTTSSNTPTTPTTDMVLHPLPQSRAFRI